MIKPGEISINDFSYELPEDRIAIHPKPHRDTSKLLCYKDGNITESTFASIDTFLPGKSSIIFNNTKVINARIIFLKPTGGKVEIFCLEPLQVEANFSGVMLEISPVNWKCLIGGAAKLKENVLQKDCLIGSKKVLLKAERIKQEGDAYEVKFSWDPPGISFAEILEAAGSVPLPPYIKREQASADRSRYQTVFAEQEGSVAAPTAGLHFTEKIFSKLAAKNIELNFVTLHVGAGTFKPVKAETMQGHDMHAEYIDVDLKTIYRLKDNSLVTAVGTTSLRTIETLYWLGAKARLYPALSSLMLDQWEIYNSELNTDDIPGDVALQALIDWMEKRSLTRIFTKTQLLIVPGYKFRIAKILITNFHQPRSTLLLLVAAAIGDDWRKMYDYALKNNFRFLSYGDGNVIWLNPDSGLVE